MTPTNPFTLLGMKHIHPEKKKVQVSYYYLPAGHERKAEIIQVFHSDAWCIQVPTREEDLELYAFFQRTATPAEIARFGPSQTWRIFSFWEELEEDQIRYGVPHEVLEVLLAHRAEYELSQETDA